jgi:hypothetical protein
MAYTRTQATWVDGSGGNTPIDAVDLENYDKGLLATNDDLVVLVWNGTALVGKTGNTAIGADTSRTRIIESPTNPDTLSGVVTAVGDLWVQY